MANPNVEKLKSIALLYGDKALVALTGVLCLLFVFMSLNKETIDTTPEQLKELANRADSHIRQNQDETTILDRLEQDGMVAQAFEKKVVELEKRRIDPSKYAPARSMVKAEPGAGLIRGEVKDELVAPYDLIATAGRGGVSFYVFDAQGNLLPAEEEDTEPTQTGPGYGMYGGRDQGSDREDRNLAEEERARREARIARQRALSGIAGNRDLNLPEEEDQPDAQVQPSDYKTEVRGQRWVAVVGLLNHKQLRERYAKALKVGYDQAHPDYERVEMERQQYDPLANQWSSWRPVDSDINETIKMEVAAEEGDDQEYTDPEVRLDPLVDFLPYLSVGYWNGVSHIELVSAERIQRILEETKPDIEDGRGGMGSGGMGMGSGGMGMAEGMGMGSGGMGMAEGMGMGSGGMGMGVRGRGGRGVTVEHTTDEEIIMVRALDLTVEPDAAYRYRLRVVVNNPNYNREDVAPGVNTTDREFAGPWSEVSNAVNVPPDVAPYAVSPARGDVSRPDSVRFDVVAWDPNSGTFAVRRFQTAPGEFIGRSNLPTLVAVEGEDEPQEKQIDFQSRQLLLDTDGGSRPIQELALSGSFEVPAAAAVLRPDGSLAMRNQARDSVYDQFVFMRDSYQLSISDEGKDKQRGGDMGMMGMMGMYGGGNTGYEGGN